MPDVMNDDDLDSLAAEYVLGTLDAKERSRAHELLEVDHGFRGKVRIWERRFGELHLMVEPVDPPEQVWERIRAGLGEPEPAAEILLPAPMPAPEPQMTLEAEPVPEPKPEPELEQTPGPESPFAPASAWPIGDSALELPSATPLPEPEIPTSAAVTPEPAAVAPSVETRLSALDLLEARLTDVPRLQTEAAAGTPPSETASTDTQPATPTEPTPLPPQLLAGAAMAPTAAISPRPRKSRGGWAFAVLMLLVALALGGLIAAWRFVPERLPPQLRPAVVLKLPAASPQPTRPALPPGSEFDE
jgi:hypothetical protein